MPKFPKIQPQEFKIFTRLNTPSKIQDFINKIPINFELQGDTCYSPLAVLRHNQAHCLEGALLAAAIFWYQGKKPLLLDLETTDADECHVVTLFKRGRCWGAVSKTNHAVLRYRDPIYKNIRELVMSYFNEYFLDSGRKTLRRYSKPFSLLRYGTDWLTAKKNLWEIHDALDKVPHFKILANTKAKYLRPADPIEIEAGKMLEWKEPRKNKKR